MYRIPFAQPLTGNTPRSCLPVYDQGPASELFDGSRRAARWHRLWSRLAGRADRLPLLADAQGTNPVSASHFAGARTVLIEQIHGSENGHADFDATFRPLNERVRGRWISVACALAEGVALPPVELIQLKDRYYVRDGHHRISVARALGQELIDATVTVLEVSTSPARRSAPMMPSLCKCRCACKSLT